MLCGKVEKHTSTGVVTLRYTRTLIDEAADSYTYATSPVGKDGRYHLAFDLERPAKVYLQDGDDYLTFNNYIHPGDSLVMNFTDSTYGFDGDCAACNAFLVDWAQKLHRGPGMEARKLEARSMPPAGFAAFEAWFRDSSLRLMTGHAAFADMTPAFRTFFRAEADSYYAANLLRYSWRHPEVLSDTAYLRALHAVPVADTAALANDEYINYLRELPYSSWRLSTQSADTVRKQYANRNQYRLRDSVARTVFTGKLYDLALYQILNDAVGWARHARGSAKSDTAWAQAAATLTTLGRGFSDQTLAARLRSALDEVKLSRPAPDFALQDLEGKTVKLSDYRGKVVYLDFWATNCAPCVAEFPYIRRLARQMAGEEDFVMISVSIGDKSTTWQAFLAKQERYGVHLSEPAGFGSAVAKEYGISGLPKYLIIDRQGFIVSDNVPRPSADPMELLKRVLSTN